ncbi:LAME_0F14422g1_1 [Lachancea meyersii CBS 8951]|uniref:LAME_0F14422g1_1 n=1 Tax=Lachancea meyersii CBS 8951 TaxID=1266667 RepID=A0A1G4JXX1_9SACH|nr:LAME_0F14422g1_1 [Lachancea meyersii CBS 8951]
MDVAEGSRVLGDPNASQNTQNSSKLLACPVCGEETVDLLQLNNHLDLIHGLGDEPSRGQKSQKVGSKAHNAPGKHKVQPSKPKFELKRDHWATIISDRSRCHKCHVKLTRSTGMINCRKCGRLFCMRHCKNAIRLNTNAEYDPKGGEWCWCCRSCAQEKPGYNDFGTCYSRTHEFNQLRSSRTEDRQLQQLQLENRFVRLMNGILRLHAKYQGSLLASLKLPVEVTQFEKSVVPWTPDPFAFACCLCARKFGITSRKHHCRLCGKVVCDNTDTNCSNQIPVTSLVNAASDLPISSTASLNLPEIETQVRVCSSCVQSIFRKRKFEKELGMPLTNIFQLYERMRTYASLILSTVASLKSTSQEARKSANSNTVNVTASEESNLSKTRRRMVGAFSAYDKLTKQLLKEVPRNESEKRIQSAIIAQASAFILENMLPLRNLTADLASKSADPEVSQAQSSPSYENSLTIKEIKDYRTQLMVIEEQKFLVEDMIAQATKQRKFDEASVLSKNLEELKSQSDKLASLLGGEGFK